MKKNILLVDDDSVFNFINRKVLETMGIADSIHTALNGKEALDLLNGYLSGSNAVPDVIFLDLNMPIMDGFAFLEAFKRVNIPNKEMVSIVIVTSSTDPADIAKAKAMGIDHYLTKPVSEAAIRGALGL